MTNAISSYLQETGKKFNENQVNQMALLEKAFPSNGTFENMMLNGDPNATAELAMQMPFNAMVAYHGTPHTIKGNFDINKVGTGEGAQAYGHGMYFAENPNVAEWYKKELGTEILLGNKPLLKANQLVGTTKNADLDNYLRSYDGDVNAIRDTLTKTVNQFTQESKNSLSAYYQNILNKLEQVAPKLKVKDTSNLYKVDIPDEHIPMMLDYDKPIKDQPEIYELIKSRFTDPDLLKTFENNAASGISGANVYKNYLGGKTDKQRSENALALGIKGIRYLDEFSRGKGVGTSNFVVFEPSTVKILEENSKPVTRKELIKQQVNKVLE
jgi:hypothetical protein